MNLVIVGYGKMGRAVEAVARERNHKIAAIIDKDNPEQLTAPELKQADAAIEFTTPESAFANYQKLMDAGLPIVSGTTGWLEHLDAIKQACQAKQTAFFYAPNFNVGVNVFFEVSKKLARLINNTEGYTPSIEEIHHVHKLDAPSGTAIKLAGVLTDELQNKTGWSKGKEQTPEQIPVYSKRTGEVPGTHVLTFDSPMDTITFTHEAKSRKGFALGAVMAAEFIQNKTGYFTMQDMLDL